MHVRHDRIARVQARMREQGLVAIMVMNPDDFRWLFGADRTQPRAVIPFDGPPIIVAFAAEEPEIRAALAADRASRLAGGDDADAGREVAVFGSVGGQIHELFYFIGGDGAWHHNLPSAAAGSVPVMVGTSPTSWYTTPENVQHIAYVGVDGLIHELFYFIGGAGGWHGYGLCGDLRRQCQLDGGERIWRGQGAVLPVCVRSDRDQGVVE